MTPTGSDLEVLFRAFDPAQLRSFLPQMRAQEGSTRNAAVKRPLRAMTAIAEAVLADADTAAGVALWDEWAPIFDVPRRPEGMKVEMIRREMPDFIERLTKVIALLIAAEFEDDAAAGGE